ncbi:Pirin (plasmid) [Rhodovastum atsumiense]|uniref:Pirin n=1 Tax=Rhodovastum atsumiense TaxID=504468 RepID=A0A5M6IMZ8_9PROT|nr:replication protein RepA [Rhodovastum atsumiense]KAA5609631.1 pirin [Rhodovastum atsumiense]CAH2606495.1 Pirin [Rhodovastum atsumiense]
MGTVHQLILRDGIEVARQQAVTKHDRSVVEAAYQVLGDDADRVGFTYSGFALTSLPHKPVDGLLWRRESAGLTLMLEAGHDRAGSAVGLPYGSYARFILLFLQSQAVKSQSRDIELGRSMRQWLETMGLSIGGTTYRLVNEQARRISWCRLTFYADRAGREIMRHGGFVDGAISLTADEGPQGALWQERVLLNEQFYQALVSHPVPVSETALQAIGARSLVLDVYVWLAYRLHALKGDVSVSWSALHAQFGGGFTRLRRFRSHFLESLQLALAAYPDARVSASETGLVLHPSKPPVPPRLIAAKRP